MMDNRTNQLCDICNSHIISYREKGKIIFECQECGMPPENIESIELDDYDYE